MAKCRKHAKSTKCESGWCFRDSALYCLLISCATSDARQCTVFQDTSHSRQASCDALSGSSNAANASVWCAPCRKCIGKFVGAAICASAWFTVYILNQPLSRKNCFFAEWLTHADRYNAFVLSRTFPCKASPHHPRSTPLLCSSCNTSSLHWLLPYALSWEPASTWSPAWY